MLRQALAKLIMRATGYQAKTACGNFQLCPGLESGIEGATHAAGQKRLDRSRVMRIEEEEKKPEEEEEKDCGSRY